MKFTKTLTVWLIAGLSLGMTTIGSAQKTHTAEEREQWQQQKAARRGGSSQQGQRQQQQQPQSSSRDDQRSGSSKKGKGKDKDKDKDKGKKKKDRGDDRSRRGGGGGRAVVVDRGPFIGFSFGATPYYYGYRSFERFPVEVAVQVELSRAGFYRGPIDGIIGPMTRNAIYRYQRRAGLRPTGHIDRQLLYSLGIR
jgi:hypothetical protein